MAASSPVPSNNPTLSHLVTPEYLATVPDGRGAVEHRPEAQSGRMGTRISETRAEASPRRTIIQPGSRWMAFDLREIWRNRELLYFFVWRDLKVRYKQTAFGALWALIQPLA